jgi:hypothetical protein
MQESGAMIIYTAQIQVFPLRTQLFQLINVAGADDSHDLTCCILASGINNYHWQDEVQSDWPSGS